MTKYKQANLSIYNYTVPCTKIPSVWFDTMKDGKEIKSTLLKMGYETFGVYMSLYKFRVHNQEHEHTFFTSIEELRKESQQRLIGHDGEIVYGKPLTLEGVTEALIKLVQLDIIEIKNVGNAKIKRSLYDANGKPKFDKFLHVVATTNLSVFGGNDERTEDGENEEYYIYVPFDVLAHYEKVGFNIKHIVMYCYLKKWTNEKGFCYKSLDNIGKDLDMDSRTVQRIIKNMNEQCMIASHKRATAKKDGSERFEHYVLDGLDTDKKVKPFIEEHYNLFSEHLFVSQIGIDLGYTWETYRIEQVQKELNELLNDSKTKKKEVRVAKYDPRIKELREELQYLKAKVKADGGVVPTIKEVTVTTKQQQKQKQDEYKYTNDQGIEQIDMSKIVDDAPPSNLPDNPASFF